MMIPTVEDYFDHNFKVVMEKMIEGYPELKDMTPEERYNTIWGNEDMKGDFAEYMLDRGMEYGGDEMFETMEE